MLNTKGALEIFYLYGLYGVSWRESEYLRVKEKRRKPVAYLTFEGEQHGFRQAKNIKRSLEAELFFYSRIFGFTPADSIEPVDIENL